MASFCSLFFRIQILFSCGHNISVLVGRDLWTDLLQPPTWRVVPSPCREDENGEYQAVDGHAQSHPQALSAAESSPLWDAGCQQEGGDITWAPRISQRTRASGFAQGVPVLLKHPQKRGKEPGHLLFMLEEDDQPHLEHICWGHGCAHPTGPF